MKNVSPRAILLSCGLLSVATLAAIAGPLAQWSEAQQAATVPIRATNEARVVEEKASPESPVRYESFHVRTASSLAELKAKLGKQGMDLVLKVNRIDLKHIRKGQTLVVPAGEASVLRLSPFPAEIPLAQSVDKMILVSRSAQAFGAYEAGRLVWWGPTSTGKKATQTPSGLYHTNWKSKETRSTVNHNWVLPWYFNFDNFQGIGFHQYDLPGYPASHACVRLLEEDAGWIYGWAEGWILNEAGRSLAAHGTPVIIFGDYTYGKEPCWKRLPEDPLAASVTIEEIEAAMGEHMPLIEARTKGRHSILARNSESIPKQ